MAKGAIRRTDEVRKAAIWSPNATKALEGFENVTERKFSDDYGEPSSRGHGLGFDGCGLIHI